MIVDTGSQTGGDQRDRSLIGEVAVLLAADRTPRETFASLCELLTRVIDVSVCFIAVRSGAALRIEYVHDHGQTRPDPAIVIERGGRSWETLRSGRSQLFRTVEDWAAIARQPLNKAQPWTDDSVSAIFVPIQAGGDRIGVLSVQSTREYAYDENDVSLLEAIGRYLAIAIRNQRLFARLQRVAEVDPLTGLANHSTVLRTIDERLSALDGDALGIILLDITNFGRINDVYGSRVGDRVLDALAEQLASLADRDTVVGRFGGDDFVIVATRPDRAALARLVDDVGARTHDLSFRGHDDMIPILVNRGWVSAPDEGTTRSDLLALADLRLRLSLEHGGMAVGESVSPLVRFGNFGDVEPLVECALLRDPYTRMHLLHVNHIAHAWAPRLELGALYETFVRAALLHDIGKLLVPEQLLLKPARLEPHEYRTMQRHADYGRSILSDYPGFEDVARIIGQHHERWDGHGYPNGVAGERIDRLARAVSVIDAFSAMTIDRPYHRAISEREALLELERCAGSQFDAEMVRSFCALRRGETA
ncbi:MAG TPA: HD domain-containing phosphohydrolase [Candidatus Sulfotelmatobacter sp.]|nr:HD domain-containing phosphohydrolase [Candidatus Sulfotelmatobacter sp.]